MPALDFKELSAAHAGAERDQFELFARDFLGSEGFEVIRGPDQGPDAGRDLSVRERRHGLIAFYSTLPSSTLATHLTALQPRYGLLIYDRERTDPTFGRLVPADDPLEEPRWVVLHNGAVVRSESVYANSSEGWKRVQAVIAATTGHPGVPR